MSKVSLLLDVVNDLKKLTGSLQTLAEALDTNASTDVELTETPAQVTETMPAEKKITLEQVRAVLAEKVHMTVSQQRSEHCLKSMGQIS